MGTGEHADVRERDVWRRNADGTEVHVEFLLDEINEGEGPIVSWLDLGRPREGNCTVRQFVRRYTLVYREQPA